MNKGFTLIELLVVVLIIGILAAVALPQYTKAVERSRTSEAIQRLGDMATAQQIYYMQYGSFAPTADLKSKGDIAFATFDTNSFTIAVATASTSGTTMKAGRTNGQYAGSTLELAIATDGAIKKKCTAAGTGSSSNEFCNLVDSAGYKTAW